MTFHSLEHISKYQVLPTLNEFARVLKPSSKLLILVPDLRWVLSSFLMNSSTEYEMDMIFGVQEHEGEFHKTGFTHNILIKYFNEIAKFNILKWFRVNAYNQYNIGLLAEKKEEVKNGR